MAPTGPSQPRPTGVEAVVDRHPALRGLPDLGGLLERRRDDRVAPAILGALAVVAPGDDLAARTLPTSRQCLPEYEERRIRAGQRQWRGTRLR
jgi:hypothetical protein